MALLVLLVAVLVVAMLVAAGAWLALRSATKAPPVYAGGPEPDTEPVAPGESDFDEVSSITALPSLGAIPYLSRPLTVAPAAPVLVTAAAASDTGHKREHNEDSFLCLHVNHVFVVADGIGGEIAGEVASKLAVEAVEAAFEQRLGPPRTFDEAQLPPLAARLVDAVGRANLAVRAAVRDDRKLRGMGTTVVAIALDPETAVGFVGHVGDSRCYRIRDRSIEQLTLDHTMGRIVGAGGAMAEKLAWALGSEDRVQVEIADLELRAGDFYLLCSDGLSKMVEDDILVDLVTAYGLDPAACVKALVDAANHAGGDDNITAIVVRVTASE